MWLLFVQVVSKCSSLLFHYLSSLTWWTIFFFTHSLNALFSNFPMCNSVIELLHDGSCHLVGYFLIIICVCIHNHIVKSLGNFFFRKRFKMILYCLRWRVQFQLSISLRESMLMADAIVQSRRRRGKKNYSFLFYGCYFEEKPQEREGVCFLATYCRHW